MPNVEHYEYMPEPSTYRNPWPRTPHPDVMNYSYRDYGNRVAFWRMLEVIDKHQVPCTASLNTAVLEHFPEVRDAMVERDWDYMSHGVYNTRYICGATEDEERAFYRDTNETVIEHTGKRMKGMLGPGLTNTERTPDLMAEAGFVYQADWVLDDQPVPIEVRSGKLVSIPYTLEINDFVLRVQGKEGPYFLQIIKDQFDVLYEESSSSGLVFCLALHPAWVGQAHRAKYLDEALGYILGHDGVWAATGDEIADYYVAHYYDQMLEHLKESGITPKGGESRTT